MIDHSILPAPVSVVAEAVGLSKSTIRRYIDADVLSKRLATLSRATWGFRDDGSVEFLVGTRVRVLAFDERPDVLRALATLAADEIIARAASIDDHLTSAA